jgi:hypothetical protein
MMKHTQRTLTMLTLLIGLTLTAAATSAQGQSTSRRVVADIPFDFTVGDKTLPAGKYQVGAATSNGEGVRIVSDKTQPPRDRQEQRQECENGISPLWPAVLPG